MELNENESIFVNSGMLVCVCVCVLLYIFICEQKTNQIFKSLKEKVFALRHTVCFAAMTLQIQVEPEIWSERVNTENGTERSWRK